jgi:putative selenium metabolism hydrolase
MAQRQIPRSQSSAALIQMAREQQEACTGFLRDLVSIPSPSGGERLVCERVTRELEALGFAEVHTDGMGNVLGRLGSGPRVLAFDAHVDTVGITDPTAWRFDPFRGTIQDGILYGRGASDQKAGLATMVHGLSLLGRVGVPEDLSIWLTATVLGEACVGLSWQYLVREHGLRPEAVVIAMPSHLGICRGQRGRVELEIETRGVSTHASHPDRGENAVYAMTPIVQAVARLHREMDSEHPLLGRGSLAVTSISSEAPSLTALPDRCLIHVDRRITLGEDRELVLRQLSDLPEVAAAKAEVRLLRWESPSWRDLVYPTDMFFPAWETPADGAIVLASVEAARQVLGREPRFHRSAFSSNACATAGMFSIPTVGFGPADEIHSHSNLDQVPLVQLVPAMAFYATLPLTYARHVGRS